MTGSPHLFQFFAQLGDPFSNQAAVGFKLCLPGSSQAHADGSTGSAAGLANQMPPHAGQAGLQVLVLSQFDLDLAFPGVGVLGKDIQYQRGAIQHFDPLSQGFFDIPLLSRAELIIEDEHAQIRIPGKLLPQLLQLSLA